MKLLFYKGTSKENSNATIWDNIICTVTHSRFSHVEISLYEVDGVHTCWSSSSRDGGVRYKSISTGTGRWVEVDVPYVQNPTAEFMARFDGKKYDYTGLIGSVLNVHYFSNNDRWFCSEIVAEALGIHKSWQYTPEDLYEIYA